MVGECVRDIVSVIVDITAPIMTWVNFALMVGITDRFGFSVSFDISIKFRLELYFWHRD